MVKMYPKDVVPEILDVVSLANCLLKQLAKQE